MSPHLQKREPVSHQEASSAGFQPAEAHYQPELCRDNDMSGRFTLIHSFSLQPFPAEIILTKLLEVRASASLQC